MIQKPEIQYVGQFYIPGSEAPELAGKKKTKAKLPKPRREKVKKVCVDPIALAGCAVAAVMLVLLVVGAFRLQRSWEEYNKMSATLSEIRRENAEVTHKYRTSLDLEHIRTSAEGMGMIPAEEAKTAEVWVSLPRPEPEPTLWDEIVWFFTGLFAK